MPGPEILALAEKIGAPVVSYRMGKGVVDSRHPLSLNTVGGFELWDKTDLLIGIGTRLDTPIARWAPAPGRAEDRAHRPRPGRASPARRRRGDRGRRRRRHARAHRRRGDARTARHWRAAIAAAKEAALAAIAEGASRNIRT